MRAVLCPCGIVVRGRDDDELFRLGRQHANEQHAEDNIPDEFIRERIATYGYTE